MANFMGFWIGQLDRSLQGIGPTFNFDIDQQLPDGHIEGRFRNSSEEETDISGTVVDDYVQFTVTYGTDVYCFQGTQTDVENRIITGVAPPGACEVVTPKKMRNGDASWDAEARNPPMDEHKEKPYEP